MERSYAKIFSRIFNNTQETRKGGNMKKLTILTICGLSLFFISCAGMFTHPFIKKHKLVEAKCKTKPFWGYENGLSDKGVKFWGTCDKDGYAHGKGLLNWGKTPLKMGKKEQKYGDQVYIIDAMVQPPGNRSYFGDWEHGIPNGEGTIDYMGSLNFNYKGQIVNGKPHGIGETYFLSFDDVEPDKKEQLNEKTIVTIKNPISAGHVKYKGEWVNGEKNGYGVQYSNFCHRYIGPFRDGLPDGIGTFIMASTETIIQEDRGSTMHSEIKWEKGMSYTGLYKDGKPAPISPTCEIVYTNNTVYRGSCKGTSRHGKGVMSENGKVIENGKWENDKIVEKYEIKEVPVNPLEQIYYLAKGGLQRDIQEMAFKAQFQRYNFAFTVVARSIGLIDSCSDPFNDDAYEKYKAISDMYQKINDLKSEIKL